MPTCAQTLEKVGPDGLFAVVATAGTTNFGIVDDLASVAEVCRELGVWFHVDGAYGGAGLAAPSIRHLYAGIEHADSFTVDPHKWFFAPFDCCALIYRDPAVAKAAHTQKAGYLDVLTDASDWNPSDYAIGLTRRARGLPFWFSLVTNGSAKYTAAIERTLTVTRHAASEIKKRKYVELLRGPGPVGRRVPPDRLDPAAVPGLVGPAAGGQLRLRRTDHPRGRDGHPVRDRQPAHLKSDINAILDTMA